MPRQVELIAATLVACTLIVFVLLAVFDIGFTPFWLLPVVGGVTLGISLGKFKSLQRRPSIQDLLHGDLSEASLQFALGLAFLVVGFFYTHA